MLYPLESKSNLQFLSLLTNPTNLADSWETTICKPFFAVNFDDAKMLSHV